MADASDCLDKTCDQGMLHALIAAHGDVVRFLSRRLKCHATAEDIAQDVFVRLSTAPIAVHHPRALIFRTASNLALNHSRDERRRAELRWEVVASGQTKVEERHPEREAIARDALRRLAEDLVTWPARTREVFILNRFDGLTQREIAGRLRISSTSIERHMARAIRNLAALSAREGW